MTSCSRAGSTTRGIRLAAAIGRCRRCTTRFSRRCSTAACCRRDVVEKLFGDAAEGSEDEIRQQLEQLIQQIIEKMQESGYISAAPDLESERQRRQQGGGAGDGEPQQVQFEVTDKALDFLGYPGAARSARLARAQQRRPSRHARPGHRRGDQRRAEALRVRRHAEPRRHRHDPERGAERRRARCGGGEARARRGWTGHEPSPEPGEASPITAVSISTIRT